MKKLSIIILISGNGSNLQSIIDAIEAGQINAKITAVISNNPDAYGLQRAKKHNITHKIINHRDFACRDDFDRALCAYWDQFSTDIIVLAGFMRVLGADLVRAYAHKIINIHPSILPNYKGLNTHQRALDNNEKEHGVSIHIVTPALDDGPIIMTGRYPVLIGDSASQLQAKGHRLEQQMYPQILRWLSLGHLQISPDSIIFQGQILENAIEFNDNPDL